MVFDRMDDDGPAVQDGSHTKYGPHNTFIRQIISNYGRNTADNGQKKKDPGDKVVFSHIDIDRRVTAFSRYSVIIRQYRPAQGTVIRIIDDLNIASFTGFHCKHHYFQ